MGKVCLCMFLLLVRDYLCRYLQRWNRIAAHFNWYSHNRPHFVHQHAFQHRDMSDVNNVEHLQSAKCMNVHKSDIKEMLLLLLGNTVVFDIGCCRSCALGSGLGSFALPLRLCRHMADNVLTPETENRQEILTTLCLVLLSCSGEEWQSSHNTLNLL